MELLNKVKRFLTPLLFGLVLYGVFSLSACNPLEENVNPNPADFLQFSTDTVTFDTVFSERPTITRSLTVYNPNKDAIKINRVYLQEGDPSPFQIVVDGTRGSDFQDLLLLGKDSLLVLVSATLDASNQNNTFFVKDQLHFELNNKSGSIPLIAWGQDAHYLSDTVLSGNIHWVADKPYVISNNLLLDTLSSLTLDPGVKIYNAPNSFLFIKGQLNASGTKDSVIHFQNDRLDEGYRETIGQWGGIVLLPGAHDCLVRYALLKNSQVGFNVDVQDDDEKPELTLQQVEIRNISTSGILGVASEIAATNCLITNCVQSSVSQLGGGNGWYTHCTFANFGIDLYREGPSFVATDQVQDNQGQLIETPLTLTIQNSIIWGNKEDELFLSNQGGQSFTANIQHTLIRTSNSDLDINNNILNADPIFVSPFERNYALDSISPALNQGADLGIMIDLKGEGRDNTPDLGALERQ